MHKAEKNLKHSVTPCHINGRIFLLNFVDSPVFMLILFVKLMNSI